MSRTPGLVDFDLEVHPLNHISPSRFQSLKTCALSEVWSSGTQPRLLANSAVSHLGSVTHRVLQAAGRGEINVNAQEEVAKRWDSVVNEEEIGMLASWLEKHLVPLSSSVADYEVRRLRTLDAVSRVVVSSHPRISGISSAGNLTGAEIRVHGPEGRIAGYIDFVYESSGDLILRDYKTGDIWEQPPGSIVRSIKGAYDVQLKLYAALYAASFSRWPSLLEIIALSGESVLLPVDIRESETLLAEALDLLCRVNAVITSPGISNEEIEDCLANPNHANCRYCSFRPGCRPYIKSRNCYSETTTWSTDIIGNCKDIRVLRNNTMMLVVADLACGDLSNNIRGLNPDFNRHPAIRDITHESLIGLFNLGSALQGQSFTETQATTIYKYNKKW